MDTARNDMKEQIINIFDRLPEQEQTLVFELVSRLDPDDILTLDDLAVHAAAMEDYKRGEIVRHEDINWS